jgi:rhomboid protease GluP
MKKKIKISYNAPTILSFVIICLIVTVIGAVTKDKSTEILFSVYHSSLTNPLTYVRMFTHVFGHIGVEHFISNAMFLLLLGPMLEEKYGSITMLKVIAFTAFFTGIIHFLFFGNSALCGASGIVFACIVLSSFTAFKDGEIPLSFILVVVLFIGKEVYNGVTIQDNISNFTHVLGGIVGSVLGYSLNKKR